MNQCFFKSVFILLLLSVVFLPSCGGESGGTDTGNPTNSYGFTDQSICETAGGEWIAFSNECLDSCASQRGESVICPEGVVFGCACSENRCWNNETSECETL